ncbi:Gas vesicle protein [Paenibacillus sp. 1_12]|uniref:YtxH domain-containing protein n=1 Tax=Paenibacillus sp. 1_12 TaxID=1566278 RepID=UPI0008EAF37C|nr:YtxH domain-containing protein [Paenibacillus sp. 1_12]SFL24806.1 Gas vesicle protein [Paenibacillus sp. 1_12]
MTTNNRNKDLLIGAVVGTVLGAVTALLFAPKSGRELRTDIVDGVQQVSTKTQQAAESIADKTKQLAGTLNEKTQLAAQTVSRHTLEWSEKAKETALSWKNKASLSGTEGTTEPTETEPTIQDESKVS